MADPSIGWGQSALALSRPAPRASTAGRICYTAVMPEPRPRRSLFAVWRWPRWALALLLIVALLTAYGTTYRLLADRILYLVFAPGEGQSTVFVAHVHYPKLQ